jgi:amino acid transporter
MALPVFSSDALSSVAYATGEIMAALLVVGSGALSLTYPIAWAIIGLLLILTTSYRQTVLAYPGGGGAYIVARDNLGVLPAQTAGAALLTDYILTVAVSVSSGVAAIESLVYVVWGHHIPVVPVCVATVILIALINLRGVRESGIIFALPTYMFCSFVALLVGVGAWKMNVLHVIGPHTAGLAHPDAVFRVAREEGVTAVGALSGLSTLAFVFLILHAFASGCTALTGVEAISNGVTAFKEPSAPNAAKTMGWMSFLLGSMFIGLAYLAVHLNVLPETAAGFGGETTISQMGRTVFGAHNPLYWLLQVFTALILVLAANTSFADFPRLGALHAHDGFLPKQLTNIGDRLVFDRGIITLCFISCLLIIGFQGDVHKLIPLYAIGVFLSFTLSQAGMVKRWFRLKSPGWHMKAFVNGLGACVTAVVLVIFAVVKFSHGAWVVVILIPTLVIIFFRIHAHYASVDEQLAGIPEDISQTEPPQHAVLVLVPGPTIGAVQAVNYARSLAGDCRAIHVEVSPEKTPKLREIWMARCAPVPLVILEAPYRDVVGPLMAYLDEVQKETPHTQITVVIPEFVAPRWWQNLLHGHTGLMLKFALLGRKNVVVTNVRYHLKSEKVHFMEMFDVQEDYEGHM